MMDVVTFVPDVVDRFRAGQDSLSLEKDLGLKGSNVTMESDERICVRDTKGVYVYKMKYPHPPNYVRTIGEAFILSPKTKVLAVKGAHNALQLFNIVDNKQIKCHLMLDEVVFWSWISSNTLGLVTPASVYHWSVDGEFEPKKMFDRSDYLAECKIVSYKSDPTEKWFVLSGNAPVSDPKGLQLPKGHAQLYSVERKASSTFEAHAASLFSLREHDKGRHNSIMISYASKTVNYGTVTSELHVKELDDQQDSLFSERPFSLNKKVDIVYQQIVLDFAVSIEISHKHSLIYIITKLGTLSVYDLETLTAVYTQKISQDYIVVTAEASSLGGFYAINGKGEVLLATVNDDTIVPFVRDKVRDHFQKLLDHAKYKEAAEVAARSPQGSLRTPDTVATLQAADISHLMRYFEILLRRGTLGGSEALNFSRILVNDENKDGLQYWLSQNKLECSEDLGDLVKTVDTDLALKIYLKASVSPKVIAAYIERREFDKILLYTKLAQCQPDYLSILQSTVRSDAEGALGFAKMMYRKRDGCPLDYMTITDQFVQADKIDEACRFLFQLAYDGDITVDVHNSLGKYLCGEARDYFLAMNSYYDPQVVGKYYEEHYPLDAAAAYHRGQCDDAMINVANEHSLFEHLARYVVERKDALLWEKVLNQENEYKNPLIDQVVCVLPGNQIEVQVVEALRAIVAADVPLKLIEILEKIIFEGLAFCNEEALQNLLIVTAMNVHDSRVMSFVNRLDNFNGSGVGEKAVSNQLYEEAFAIFEKFNLNEQAVRVLLDNICNIKRAVEYAHKVDKRVVWSHVAMAQLREGMVSDAFDAATKADDSKTWKEVCFACVEAKDFIMAETCGLKIIGLADYVDEVCTCYQSKGFSDELIALMKRHIAMGCAHD